MERFEVFQSARLLDYESNKWKGLEYFFLSQIPFLGNYKSRLHVTILYLDLICTYRGWRHSKGLPVRGQRTWSNAWSPYKSNLILREIKLKIAKKFYGNVPENEINVAYLAEDINSLWKVQWDHEWKAAKKKMKLANKGNKKAPAKVDLVGMARGNIILDDILQKKAKANKRKRLVQKNVYMLGFDAGFTKFILQNTANAGMTIATESKKNKKTEPKKKVDIKVQKIAHETRKKKKKSLWD